uniref:WASH-7_N domain-containing protein n=1 Tax=Macrostomum lignano TaxID=282301 RepID=A0A1I8FQX9_9PLAT
CQVDGLFAARATSAICRPNLDHKAMRDLDQMLSMSVRVGSVALNTVRAFASVRRTTRVMVEMRRAGQCLRERLYKDLICHTLNCKFLEDVKNGFHRSLASAIATMPGLGHHRRFLRPGGLSTASPAALRSPAAALRPHQQQRPANHELAAASPLLAGAGRGRRIDEAATPRRRADRRMPGQPLRTCPASLRRRTLRSCLIHPPPPQKSTAARGHRAAVSAAAAPRSQSTPAAVALAASPSIAVLPVARHGWMPPTNAADQQLHLAAPQAAVASANEVIETSRGQRPAVDASASAAAAANAGELIDDEVEDEDEMKRLRTASVRCWTCASWSGCTARRPRTGRRACSSWTPSCSTSASALELPSEACALATQDRRGPWPGASHSHSWRHPTQTHKAAGPRLPVSCCTKLGWAQPPSPQAQPQQQLETQSSGASGRGTSRQASRDYPAGGGGNGGGAGSSLAARQQPGLAAACPPRPTSRRCPAQPPLAQPPAAAVPTVAPATAPQASRPASESAALAPTAGTRDLSQQGSWIGAVPSRGRKRRSSAAGHCQLREDLRRAEAAEHQRRCRLPCWCRWRPRLASWFWGCGPLPGPTGSAVDDK